MKVALIGNQNSGKSTLFNTLTGSNQKIGNWPGVTIEKKTGVIINTNYELVDLPGIYSLNAYTTEEKVTRDFIAKEDIDVIVNIIDCNSISRGLYLTSQLLELNKKIIIALNMCDIAEKKGIFIDEDKLSQALGGVTTIKISAITGIGCKQLVNELKNVKMKNDKYFLKNNFENKHYRNDNFEKNIEERYENIDNILNNSMKYTKKYSETLTDKLDKILLNKFLAVPIFAAVMLLIYYISIDIVGNKTINIINDCFELFSGKLETWLATGNVNSQLISLLIDGVINGVSAVVTFLPQLTFLFISISYLEKVGYMSRISLIFDKLFKRIGISGNSIIPFIVGTGCSVPGVMATRTIKNEREKKITAVLTPFIPCSAKLPIISLFSSYFFMENTGLIAVSFYLLAIMVIIFSALLFKHISKDTYKDNYISELPEFRMPKVTQILKDTFEKVGDFVKRAGSIVLLSSIVLWTLLSYSLKINFSKEANKILEVEYGVEIEDSILANIGKTFSWIFIPMVGENSWEIAVSSIQGLIAKEQVISSMAIISGLETGDVSNNIFVHNQGGPFYFFNQASAYAYVCFNLFSAPCFGAIGAMKKVLGGAKNTLIAVGYQIGISYIISCLIYNIGNFIFLKA